MLPGSLIVTKLSLAAVSRQDGAEAARHPHYLYAAEVQSFIHAVDFPTIPSEAWHVRADSDHRHTDARPASASLPGGVFGKYAQRW